MNVGSERLLLLPLSPRDGAIAREELRREGMEAQACGSIDELCTAIRAGAAAALVSEDQLDEPAHDKLRELLRRQPAWSDFPLLIIGARTRDRAATETKVERLGNVTWLDPPLRLRTLRRAAAAALRARRRQYEAARAIDERDRFLAMLGHELRNPLSAIALAVDVAKGRQDATKEFALIEHQTSHLSRLVDDLLDVARVTRGKITLKLAPVELGTLVEQVASSHSARFIAACVELGVTVPGDPIMVSGDAVRLEQVVSNLITNALKYTPRGGRVQVSVASEGGSAVLVVEDDGVGISSEMLPRIFEAFAQSEQSLARSQGGMGVGLTLVEHLVRLHGGSITASSPGSDRGSRFELRVPLSAELEFEQPRALRHPSNATLTIVVVDDHEDVRHLLEEALEMIGHTVAVAADGESGLRLIEDVRPDAAIVDIGLPDVDGYEVARRVRSSLDDSVQLIAFTGYGQPADRERTRAAGFDHHLTKPVSLRSVLDVLSKATEACTP